MRALGFVALILAVPAQAAPVAIKCDFKVDSSTVDYEKVGSQFEVVFVLDDVAKTVMRVNDRTQGIEPWCSDCKWSYGASKISYMKGVIGRDSSTFEIDRVAGTARWEFSSITRQSADMVDRSATCTKTAMPKLSAPNAKF